MNKELVSIIVPVYNVEKYLDKCIGSILRQTYTKIEVILVDDGSSDNSGKICEQYAKRDKRIKVLHKANGGLSDARNYGIEKCAGKYITFVDSDDYVDSRFIEILHRSLVKNSADLVIGGLRDYYEGEEITEPSEEEYDAIELSREETYRKMFLQEDIDVNATAKLYKRKIFEDIRFPKGQYYEDIQVVDKIIELSNKIVMLKYKGYYYLQRDDSIMYGSMSDKKLVLLDKIEQLVQLMRTKYPENEKYAVRRKIYCYYHILGRSILDKHFNNVSKKIKREILGYKKLIIFQRIYSYKEKIATIVLLFGLPSYKVFWKCYCKLLKNNRRI